LLPAPGVECGQQTGAVPLPTAFQYRSDLGETLVGTVSQLAIPGLQFLKLNIEIPDVTETI